MAKARTNLVKVYDWSGVRGENGWRIPPNGDLRASLLGNRGLSSMLFI